MATYKMKTKKSFAKRVKRNGVGGLKIRKAGRRHLAHGKTTKVKRLMRKAGVMSKADASRSKQLLQHNK